MTNTSTQGRSWVTATPNGVSPIGVSPGGGRLLAHPLGPNNPLYVPDDLADLHAGHGPLVAAEKVLQIQEDRHVTPWRRSPAQ